MIQCLDSIAKDILPVLQYSGRTFYQLGQYYQCLNKQNFNYNLVSFVLPNSTLDLGTVVGLCLPKQCQQSIIKKTLNQILIRQKISFEVGAINSNVPAYQYEYSWLFFITVFITLVTAILTIVATFLPNKSPIGMFSISETKKIFRRNPQSNLNVFNGIRALSMIWVVIGHTMSFSISGMINIASSLEPNTLLKPYFLPVEAGLFAVDVFFYVGGFLLAYVFLKEKQKSKAKYPLAFLQRILRFWPSYLYAILIYYTVYLHSGEGPRWGADETTVRMCSNMWRTLFFVDNLVNNGQTQCMGWGWYVQNDMQLFIMSLFLMFLYSIKPLASKILMIILMVGSMAFTYIWTYDNGTYVISHLADFSKSGDYLISVYMKPWARAPPYILGLLLGIFYVQNFEQKEKYVMSLSQNRFIKRLLNFQIFKVFYRKIARIFLELLGFAIMLFLIFIPRTLQVGTEWPQELHSLYQATAKVFFVGALSLMLMPSLSGSKQSIVRFLMDTNFFNFIAKISFCTYLIHLTVLNIWLQSRTYDRYYTIVPIFVQFCGVLVISLTCGLAMTFMIEVPFSKLQKMFITFLKNKILKKYKVSQPKQKMEKSNLNSKQGINQSLISQKS